MERDEIRGAGKFLQGGCFCGVVRYRGSPIGSGAHCHCTHCRRSSGAAFLSWLRFDAESFEFTQGSPASYQRRNDEGLVIRRRFCNVCGTQLTYERPDRPQRVVVTAGSLDEPEYLAPTEHIWTSSQLGWAGLDDGLPRYPKRPPAG